MRETRLPVAELHTVFPKVPSPVALCSREQLLSQPQEGPTPLNCPFDRLGIQRKNEEQVQEQNNNNFVCFWQWMNGTLGNHPTFPQIGDVCGWHSQSISLTALWTTAPGLSQSMNICI